MAETLRFAETVLPTNFGDFRCIVYHLQDGLEHVALIKGDVANKPGVLLRIQSECLTGEVFSSQKCDCKHQLDKALSLIENEGTGILLYLRQEGRGIGLGNKIKAYHLQEKGVDTVDANRILGFPDDSRDFCCAIRILRDLGVASVRVLTNNPMKVDSLVNAGIHVLERLPLLTDVHHLAQDYLKVKGQRMGHFLDEEKLSSDSLGAKLIKSRLS
ncbi:MAG: GTP cyclohydrolase II [Myxococcales bacterium]|nr:MAG: GTP cyclohydrolase II [Myxococcales bacterium]